MMRDWSKFCLNLVRRFASTACGSGTTPVGGSGARNRVVLVSTSNSIYENLAYEEWMYERTDFMDTDYLLLWRNRPAIVCGRHQNVWMEANVPQARIHGVDVARRSSGGGTVYHDEGNMNLSFLKSRARYNRKENLQLVVDAIKSHWDDLNLVVTDRHDILLDNFYKVSGTAAKLGRTQSFHHFTLLLDADKTQLCKLLSSTLEGADSRATKSVPANVRNLQEYAPDMTFELLTCVIGQCFLRETGQKMSEESFRTINPTDETDFPGVSELLKRLQTWDWVYGKTPKFSLHRVFSVPGLQSRDCTLHINIDVESGRLVSVHIHAEEQGVSDLLASWNQFYRDHVGDVKLTQQNIALLKLTSLAHLHETFSSTDSFMVSQSVVSCVGSCFNFL